MKRKNKPILAVVVLLVISVCLGLGTEYMLTKLLSKEMSYEINGEVCNEYYVQDVLENFGYSIEGNQLSPFLDDPHFVIPGGEASTKSIVILLSEKAKKDIPVRIYLGKYGKAFSEEYTAGAVIYAGNEAGVFKVPADKYEKFRVDADGEMSLDKVQLIDGEVNVAYQNQSFSWFRMVVLSTIIFVVLGAVIFIYSKGWAAKAINLAIGCFEKIWPWLLCALLTFLAYNGMVSIWDKISNTGSTFYEGDSEDYQEVTVNSQDTIVVDLIPEIDHLNRIEIRYKGEADNQGVITYTIKSGNMELLQGKVNWSNDVSDDRILISVPQDLLEKNVKYNLELHSNLDMPITVWKSASSNEARCTQVFQYTKGRWLKASLVGLIFFMVVVSAFILIVSKKLEVHKRFLVLALMLGSMAVVINPPYNTWDECRHFARAWDISNGNLLTECYDETGLPKADVPVEVSKMRYLVQSPDTLDYNQVRKVMLSSKWVAALTEERSGGMVRVSQMAVSQISFISYIPQVIGIWIGKILGLSALMCLYLARFANMLAATYIGYRAIKDIPRFKSLFILLFFLPGLIWSRSSCSLDGLLMSLVLGFMARVVYIRSERDRLIHSQDLMYLAGMVFMISQIKVPYIIVVFVLFGMKFEYRQKTVPMWGIIAALFLGGLGCYYIMGKILTIYTPTKAVSTAARTGIGLWLEHPLQMMNYHVRYWTETIYEFLLAAIDAGEYNHIALLVLVGTAIASDSSGVMSARERKSWCILGFIGCMLIQYIFYYQSAAKIMGYQGRYLQPFLPFVLLPLANGKKGNEIALQKMTLIWSAFLFVIWSQRFINSWWIG